MRDVLEGLFHDETTERYGREGKKLWRTLYSFSRSFHLYINARRKEQVEKGKPVKHDNDISPEFFEIDGTT